MEVSKMLDLGILNTKVSIPPKCSLVTLAARGIPRVFISSSLVLKQRLTSFVGGTMITWFWYTIRYWPLELGFNLILNKSIGFILFLTMTVLIMILLVGFVHMRQIDTPNHSSPLSKSKFSFWLQWTFSKANQVLETIFPPYLILEFLMSNG